MQQVSKVWADYPTVYRYQGLPIDRYNFTEGELAMRMAEAESKYRLTGFIADFAKWQEARNAWQFMTRWYW